MPRLIDAIESPADLKRLSREELPQVAQELREAIIEAISKTGGHFSGPLGAVELCIALHRVFDSPRDRLIFDVGYQGFAHKILTGRRDRFPTIRQLGGLAPFLSRAESEHDIFGAGHGGTSLSAAVGIATARDLNKDDYDVVAIIGDGSITAGMAYEALNQAGHLGLRLLVILNDNGMSIAPNVGALNKYTTRIRSDRRLEHFEEMGKQMLHKLPLGDAMLDVAKRVKRGTLQLVVPGMIFEELGFTYLGPIDGHDINALIEVLERARHLRGNPVLLHIVTRKGKGFEPAEEDAWKWHTAVPFDPKSAKPLELPQGRTYTHTFTDTLIALAEQDPRVVAITAAMPDGTGLVEFAERFPDRFFDVGMAEQHAVTFAAGLAANGMRPVVAIYSTFLQRGFDQIVHDVCVQRLPVLFAIDRGGLVAEDGPTHHGAFDLVYLRGLPNMVMMAPKDLTELAAMLRTGLTLDQPAAVRYSRHTGLNAPEGLPEPLSIGRGELVRDGGDVAIVALGYMVDVALEAANRLQHEGIEAAVVNARFVKPMDQDLICEVVGRCGRLVTAEDGVLAGGFGSAVLQALAAGGVSPSGVAQIGIPDRFIEHGQRGALLERLGMTADGIMARCRHLLGTAQVAAPTGS